MNDSGNQKDTLFAQKIPPGDFVFDDKVAGVFEDMINRSIPGYSTIIAMIGVLAERYCQGGSRIYDLGCSLGGATFTMAERATGDCLIVAVDNSRAMIDRCKARLPALGLGLERIDCRCEDILDTEISDASVVVLNFTLQFIAPGERAGLMKKIHSGMRPGGILIVSEKILFPDESLNALFVDLYHDFKESMGYSKLEISRKRTALENVLIPETIDTHRRRLSQTGFTSFDVWFQCFNFVSMVAFKGNSG